MHKYATPPFFLKFSNALLPWAQILVFPFFGIGLYYAFYHSPPDYVQGETVRILYIHVPSAWLGLGLYLTTALFSLIHLVWRHSVAEYISISCAKVGVVFTFICLVTGSIWGKPTWGVWWVWDARLTSMLLLFFLYLGYLMLVHGFEQNTHSRAANIFAILGALNLPVIKWSVNLWSTLHQGSTFKFFSKSTIHVSFIRPLGFMLAGFVLFTLIAVLKLTLSEISRRKALSLEQKLAHGR